MTEFEDGPDYEPDEHVDVYVGTVRHACGHSQQHFNCNVEGARMNRRRATLTAATLARDR
jgi:hypothetical protein